ncbi:hypothetical protein FAP39_07025 [Shimia litoralis]|uniref:Uncharacterized protein n=1 Tax=Shimia litoralis TaxID=420403 RepID=A0A4U7N6F4_9RHOB|nr:hypothetical protein [Shimia litoralis]TKZ21173.1 hypothetical protein FAP39_07025 [Shimia litoralis]
MIGAGIQLFHAGLGAIAGMDTVNGHSPTLVLDFETSTFRRGHVVASEFKQGGDWPNLVLDFEHNTVVIRS